MQTIPIADQPSQFLTTMLAGQQCWLRIFTRGDSLWLDLTVAGIVVVAGALCLNGVLIVRDAYLGFPGDLMFVDTQGSSDPASPGLGTRFQLAFVATDELEDF